MLKIIIDENISYASEAFSSIGQVTTVHGRKITNELLKDADVLIVRSITNVDEKLLNNTKVRFVGTATIGTDHIDLNYLNKAGIAFSDAKGCNADAVTEYVFSSITKLLSMRDLSIQNMSIGIVGTGNIGSRIAKIGKTIGMHVLKNDPPLQRKYGNSEFTTLDNIFDCDIITLHVPLNKTGQDKTVHLFNNDNLEKIKDNSIFINASRGQVTDNNALLNIIDKKGLNVVLDVWENEPDINTELLKKIKFGTPHIAGYSLEGKVNGTAIIYRALCNFLGIAPEWIPEYPYIDNRIINPLQFAGSNGDILSGIISTVYNMSNDDAEMRKSLNLPINEVGPYFDSLRKNYPLRREFINYKIAEKSADSELNKILGALRFNLPDK